MRGIKRLTIKLNRIEPDALKNGSVALLPSGNTVFLGATQVDLQQKVKRSAHNGENNGKSAESPAPVRAIEALCSLWASESGDNVRRRSKGVRKTSVLQLGRVGGNDIHAVDDSTGSNQEEDIGGAESRQIVTCSHYDHAQCSKEGHNREAFRTAPDVHHL